MAFSIAREDIDDWKQRLESGGVSLESTVSWPRGGISLYFRDPDNHLIELATPGIWSVY